MDQNERQVIDELFGKLRQAEAQSGPRDKEAEDHIRTLVSSQPAAPYLMAQAIVIQEQALAAAQARIQEVERELAERPAGGGGFLGSLFGGGAPARPPARAAQPPGYGTVGDPRVAAYANPHQQRPGGGFLGGAMQTAMGVAGGMLIGSMLADAFSSGGEAIAAEAAEALPEEIPEDTGWDLGGDEEQF
jgi:hypothetical protein